MDTFEKWRLQHCQLDRTFGNTQGGLGDPRYAPCCKTKGRELPAGQRCVVPGCCCGTTPASAAATARSAVELDPAALAVAAREYITQMAAKGKHISVAQAVYAIMNAGTRPRQSE